MSWEMITHGSGGDGSDLDGVAQARRVHHDRVEHMLERGDGVTVVVCLLAQRGRQRKIAKPVPQVRCPGADSYKLAVRPGEERIASTVFRRRRNAIAAA